MNWWQRLKARLAIARLKPGELLRPSDPSVQEQAVYENKGPMPDDEVTAAHNLAIDREYEADVTARKALYAQGLYRPRFFTRSDLAPVDMEMTPEMFTDHPELFEVNWHLEMAAEPGRRTDVTLSQSPGLPVLSPSELADQVELDDLKAGIASAEGWNALAPVGSNPPVKETPPTTITARHVVGPRAMVLAACHGNEILADKVEAKAMELLGTTTMDEPSRQNRGLLHAS